MEQTAVLDTEDPPGSTRPKWLKPALMVAGLVAVIATLKATGVTQAFSPENIGKVEAAIEGLGVWGPVAYIGLYIVGCLFFLPGSALTLLAGIFGPWWGTVYVSIASTVGAALSFLLARYAVRPMVEKWAETNPVFKKIDDGVEEHGWRMVMITRLVPLFPFNFQNYAYGLTKVSFPVYVGVSWLCMLPGTAAYVILSGSVIGGGGDIKKTLTYLAVAGVLIVGLSFLPTLLKKKYQLEETAAPPAE